MPRNADSSEPGLAPCLPLRVLVGQAHGAWPVHGRDGGLLVGEEHAMPDVPAARDGPERGRAVEPAVHAARPVAAERAGGCALVGLPVRTQQRVRPGGHAAPSSVSRARLASTPPTYCPIVPSLRTTRWQGTTTGRGLLAHALPAARTAFGWPAAFAIAA